MFMYQKKLPKKQWDILSQKEPIMLLAEKFQMDRLNALKTIKEKDDQLKKLNEENKKLNEENKKLNEENKKINEENKKKEEELKENKLKLAMTILEDGRYARSEILRLFKIKDKDLQKAIDAKQIGTTEK
jgi:hypothetical protein